MPIKNKANTQSNGYLFIWYFISKSLRSSHFSLQAADLDGEIDLSTCCNVTEYPVQRNYGFQIHVSTGVEFGDRLDTEVGDTGLNAWDVFLRT